MFSRRDASNTDRSSTTDPAPTVAPQPVAPTPAVQQAAPQPVPTAQVRNNDESLVAHEDTFEGKLRTSRGVRVLGTVTGEIESSKYVHIEENARVEADITAEEVVIAGEYSGKLTCRSRVEIRSSGRVSGHIDTQKLLLHEGGYFDGELHMQKPSTTPSATTSPAKTDSDERPRRTRYVDISSDASSTTREVGATNESGS